MINIFDTQNDKVIITPHALLIPEFKKLVEVYTDPIAALSYVYFMTHPLSPYADVPEADKSEIVSADVGGDFGLDDADLEAALKKAEFLYTTPTKRLYLDGKIGLEKMGAYIRTTTIESGRDGNDTTYLSMLKSMGIITKQFKELEKQYNEETASSLRGSAELSYDE